MRNFQKTIALLFTLLVTGFSFASTNFSMKVGGMATDGGPLPMMGNHEFPGKQTLFFPTLPILGEPAVNSQVKGTVEYTYQYPIITNKRVQVYQGDSIVHVTANGIPAIIAQPNQNVPKLLTAVDISRKKFARINDTPPLFIDDLITGAVYYLKNKKNKAQVPFHYVRPKETIWDISQMYAIKKKKLLKKNRMEPNEQLQVGRKLYLQKKRSRRVPVEVKSYTDEEIAESKGPWARFIKKTEKTGVADNTNAPKGNELIRIENQKNNQRVDPNARFHTVREGETIFTISKLYGKTVLELKEWNNLDYNNINLKPGDVILVKGEELPSGMPSNTRPNNANSVDPLASPTILKPTNSNRPDSAYTPNPLIGNNQPPYGQPNPNANPYGQPAGAAGSATHIVQKGEGLYGIARKYNVSPQQLMAWNGMDSNTMLEIGDQVYVADPSTANAAAMPPVNGNNAYPNVNAYNPNAAQPSYNPNAAYTPNNGSYQPAGGNVAQTHIVNKGETLYRISKQYNTSVDKLKEWNNLYDNSINEGQELTVSAPAGNANANPYAPQPNAGNQPVAANSNYNPYGQPAADPYSQPAADPYSQPAATNPYGQPAANPDSVNMATVNPNMPYPGAQPNQPNAAQPNAAAPAPGKHKVQPTDDIYTLAAKYSITVENLREWNNIPFGTDIQTGQQLIVDPNVAKTATNANAVSPNQPAADPNANPNYYQPAGQPANANPQYQPTGNPAYQPAGNPANQPAADPNANYYSAQPAAQPAASANTHTVQKGETLFSIARNYGLKWQQLKNINNLSSNEIYVGQELKVSGGGGATFSNNATYHTVEKGDTLYSISKKYKVSMDKIKELSNKNTNEIFTGEKLRVK